MGERDESRGGNERKKKDSRVARAKLVVWGDSGRDGYKNPTGLRINDSKDMERTKESQLDNKENLMEVEMEEFRQDGKRMVLKDQDQNMMNDTTVEKRKGMGTQGGTWKRIERKTKAISVGCEQRHNEKAQRVDYKRIAQQKEEWEDSTGEAKVRKRAKGTEMQKINSNFEVEIGYLEWPQLDK